MALTYVVEVSFTTSPDNPAPVWVDISAFVDLTAGIQINRGRTDAFSETQPGRATLTLDNSDGRFTPGLTTSPYYPNVKLARRIRISVTDGVTTWRRFDGRVDAWPTQWAPTGRYARATITCQDRLKRLGQVNLPNIIAAEVLDDDPTHYWMFGEPAGSTEAVDYQGNAQKPSLEAVGTVTFGTATGPGTDGLTAASFGGSGYLYQATGVNRSASNLTVECWFSRASTPTIAAGRQETLVAFTGGNTVYPEIGDTGGLCVRSDGRLSTSDNTISSVASVMDGATHHAVWVMDVTGTSTQYLYLDGALVASDLSSVTSLADTTGAFQAGGSSTGVAARSMNGAYSDPEIPVSFRGTLAHVAIYDGQVVSAARVTEHHLSGSTGFAGDGSGARVARLARYAGVDTTEVSVDSGLTSVAAQETTGDTVISQMREAETTEAGVLFISRTGAVTFHSRSRRFDAASSFTLTGEQYEADLTLVLDDFGVANDVTVTRGAGTDARVVNTTSVADIGTYSRSITTIARTDSVTRDRANWEANKTSTPVARWPQVTVDPLTIDSIRASVFNAEISTRFTLSGLPSTAPASTVDLMVEGYDEQINLSQHTITFNCSPFDPWRVWKLDDAAFSLLGSTTYLSF